MKKLIKLSDTHYIVVDDSEIKESGSIFNINTKEIIINWQGHGSMDWWKKITHSTQPLVHPNCCISKEGITNMNKGCSERNGCLGNKQIIPLSEVEEAINGYSVEELINNKLKSEIEFGNIRLNQTLVYSIGLEDGFKVHQELVKDKLLLTDKDLFDFLYFAKTHSQFTDGAIINKFKETLLPKTEWDIELDEQGKIKLL